MNLRRLTAASFAVLTTFTLHGCGGLDLDESAPPGFDLSGEWRLQGDLSDPAPDGRRLADAADREAVRKRSGARPLGGAGPELTFINHDFPILTTRRMVIEQNRDSMGVRFDNGRYRDVSWGVRDRGAWRVQAGWHDGNLQVHSRGEEVRVIETYRLEDDGSLLSVEIAIEGGPKDVQTVRVFAR